jgi:hypothetical protein
MYRLLAGLSLLTLVGCPGTTGPGKDTNPNTDDSNGGDPCDEDGDGFCEIEGDCDETNKDINPGATEICDGLDNDCDSNIDEDVTSTFYMDSDGDGYGDPNASQDACEAGAGYVANSLDCDDTNGAIYPEAPEVCDGIDNNCDGNTDEGVTSIYHADSDGDTYGDPLTTVEACEAPSGYVTDDTDCDDSRASAFPGNMEVCDEVDNDCNGLTDDGVQSTFYADIDGDEFGSLNLTQQACSAPSGYVTDSTDCDDGNADVNPAAAEVCNNIDDNCDGQIDENTAGDVSTWYEDADGDNYGNANSSMAACVAPRGYVADNTDCDDRNAAVNPGATEVCDSIDNDCDGDVDEVDAQDASTWYIDQDGDGYGNSGVSQVSCTQPNGYVAVGTDCNDASALANPGATEVCDGLDNNCDGRTDENSAVDTTTWYEDADGDFYGNLASSMTACDQPAGYIRDSSDCDDRRAQSNPNATEYCNGYDDNCDGTVDEASAVDASDWYQDSDGDNYGNRSVRMEACNQPAGYVADNTDCDDTVGSTYPGAPEYCNGVDDDCDGVADDSAVDASTWYIDIDGDSYGDSAISQVACNQPSGYVLNFTDCNDRSNAAYPGATEVCDNIDNDCDGISDESDATDAQTWYQDFDSDNYGNASVSQNACDQPSGYVLNSTDCNDARAASYPGAPEYCNGFDDDCDGTVDEADALNVSTWYQDSDRDNYGNASVSQVACNQPSGYVADRTDCDDTVASTYPGANEACDGVDNDCDGAVDESGANGSSTWYRDVDGDNYGDINYSQVSCTQPSGYVSSSTDCNDLRADVNPGAAEVCDGVDNDCDGTTDEASAVNASTWYQDSDSDTYGNASVSQVACNQPAGYVSNATDCDDARAATYPGAPEYCNGYDDDCDGTVDESASLNATTWYQDADSDTYGNASVSQVACNQPAGYVSNNPDCNDASSAVNPGATERCNGIDDDCDGSVDESTAIDAPTWYLDADSDGYGRSSNSTVACSQPSGYVSNSTDCNDVDATAYPGASEYCDGVDDDCDGTIDDNPVNGNTYYDDDDGDGMGDANDTVSECSVPSGYVDNDYDCNDADSGEPVVADAIEGSSSGSGSWSDPFDSLQDAIDAAGECVIAMNGTYNEAIDLSGRNIDVWGVDGADVTTIDPNATVCTYANPYSCEAAVTIVGNGATPTLRGFTIQGGSGHGSSSTTNTTCADSSASHAGSNTCTVTIFEYYGGGLYINGDDPILEDIIVTNNTLPDFDQVSISSFTQYWLYSYGGGIAILNSLAELTGVTVESNYADQGGGIYVSTNSTASFDQGLITDNDATDGAGVAVSASTISITNAAIYCNTADTDGGGIFTEVSGSNYLTNIAFYRNEAASGTTHGADAYVGSSTTLYLYNSITQANSAATSLYGAGTGYLEYNNVSNSSTGGTYGGTLSGGTGSISSGNNYTSVDCDGNSNDDNFALRSGSASVNTGNPAAAYNDYNGTRNDMGAYGGPGGNW